MGEQCSGGRGGIRTHGTLAGTPVFKTGALNHSATLPNLEIVQLSVADRERLEDAATALLPNVVGAFVYGGAQYPVNRRSRLPLHVRHQVAVDVHRDRDR